MGFWLFAAIEVIYIAFFITITIFVSSSLGAAKDGRKDAKKNDNDKDVENYDKAIHLLNVCVGIGWTLIILGIIAIILSLFVAPEAGVASLAAEAASAEGYLEKAYSYEKMLGDGDFSKLKETIRFATQHRQRIPEMQSYIDKLYEDLEEEKHGLLYYNKVFGMTGVIGTIEKVILWLSAALLFGISVTAAAAAGYIGRTSTKMGYNGALIAALIGIFPFSIMVIWGVSNAIYTHQKGNRVNQDEATIKKAIKDNPRRPSRRSSRRPPPTNGYYTPRRQAPPPPHSSHASHQGTITVDQAHKALTSLQGYVDPNSKHGQLLSSATDILSAMKS